MSTKYSYQEMCDYLFKWHAPNFNFEHGGEELLQIALERGFIDMIISAHPEGADPKTYTHYVVNGEY